MKVCEYCGKDENEREIYFRAIYHPFDNEPTTEAYICDYCGDNICWCDTCGREIYEFNGMRKNIRYDDNMGEMTCVKCLQEHWFVEGMEKFNDGDWFLDSDLLEHGFVKHSSHFCRSDQSYKDAEKQFIYLQGIGNLVILSIEASGMGFEHHIAIWKKPKRVDKHE